MVSLYIRTLYYIVLFIDIIINLLKQASDASGPAVNPSGQPSLVETITGGDCQLLLYIIYYCT